ncbi:MAG TPA: hypothetical protein VGG66_01980 [Rhizomicrobium sp.]|jgi:hypothetical protein
MKIRTMMFAAALLTAGSGLALAQNGAPPAGGAGGGGGGGGRMAACRDDAQKLCPDKRGPDRRACMEANKDKLSDGCKAAMAAAAGNNGQ